MAQPWLSSARWDTLLIISPAFLTSIIAIVLSASRFEQEHSMPLWAWVCLVVCVDIAHVYATLFRTYSDPVAYKNNQALLLAIPISCWSIGFILYSVDGLVFWKALAYLAVFHFIRQQFGFMAMYSRKEPPTFQKFKWLDGACLYLSAICPILYWHTHMPRNFVWFVEGDFFQSMPYLIWSIGLVLFAVVTILYVGKEVILAGREGYFNIPKNLIVSGTAISWWVGIVALNSDIGFTLTNVLTHGIPYMALIWL